MMLSLLCLLAAWFGLGVGMGALAAETDKVRSIPPFLDSDMGSRFWEFGGDTVVRADKYIRLASDHQSRAGWLFSKIPLTATNWEIEFEFKIHGNGALHGDGMAMWITKQRGQPGGIFGSVDKFEGLAIFIDTYRNNRPGTVFPYVMAMMGDGNTPYNKDNDGKDQELAGCSARQLRGASIPTKGRLTYYQDKSMTLDLQYKQEEQWENCFSVEPPPKIPNVAYLGFSAETGELTDNFDIIEVNTKNLYVTQPQDPNARKNNKNKQKGKKVMSHSEKERGSWKRFFFKLILLALVCGGAYVGYTIWRTQKRGSRFD